MDEELMELYRKGSVDAFNRLYERHKAKVYGYIKKRVENRFEQDEIHQNVFLKLHHSRDKYNSSFPFLPWLFTILRNVLIDFRRAEGIRKNRTVDSEELLESFSSEKEQDPGTPDLSPALSSLSEIQKRAVRLRYAEDYSFEEIAAALDTSVPNARQLLSRAVRRLKSLLVVTEQT